MPRRVISKYTKGTLSFFGQPISFLLREQVRLLLLAVALMLVEQAGAVDWPGAQSAREPQVVAGQVLVHLTENVQPLLARDNSMHFSEQSLDQISEQVHR